MALRGLRVVEFAGLAPVPLCGMLLADFGAKVIRIDKVGGLEIDRLGRGKWSVSLDLKQEAGVDIARHLCRKADVLIEPFRPGVMEKLGLGPKEIMGKNPRLVYARLTGYGQTGPLATYPGHDINYLAMSGILSTLGRKGEKPYAPINLLADFAGGSLVCAMGITFALLERNQTGQGQVVDSSMVEGAAYLSSWLWRSMDLPSVWGAPRGENWLDGGGHFYDTYQTKDGKYIAVGAIEPQFYMALIKGLGLSPDEAPQFGGGDKVKELFTEVFATKTQTEWCKIFDGTEACVTPVLELDEAAKHPHSVHRKAFISNVDGTKEPAPAPHLSTMPGCKSVPPQPKVGQHTKEVLFDLGYSAEDVKKLQSMNVIYQPTLSKL